MLLLTALALLPALSTAVKTVTACVQTCGELTTTCVTEYDIQTAYNISTTTLTNTVPETTTVSATETTIILTTVTPSPVSISTTITSTVITTTTIANVSSTLTIRSTTTETATQTINVYTTVTDTSTSSITVTTTTNTAGATFLPVSDTRNGYPSSPKRERDLLARGVQEYGHGVMGNMSQSVFQDTDWHPKLVRCEVKSVVTETRIVYSTAYLNSTTTATQSRTATLTQIDATTIPAANLTVTLTTTVTSTSTQGPSTISETVTSTVTSTTTVDTTVTNTQTTATTTTQTFTVTATPSYCAANNMIGPSYVSNGQTRYISNAFNNGPGTATTYTVVSATDATDCCNQCTGTYGSTCPVWYWQSGLCLLFSYSGGQASVCSQPSHPSFWTWVSSGSDGITVGNGLCGYFYEGTADD